MAKTHRWLNPSPPFSKKKINAMLFILFRTTLLKIKVVTAHSLIEQKYFFPSFPITATHTILCGYKHISNCVKYNIGFKILVAINF